MREFSRLWRALSGEPVLAGVEAEWRERLGADVERVRSFLKPEQRLADVLPCPSAGGEHCPRRVVVHAPDDIVAVCGNTPAECPSVRVERRDLVVYRLDVHAWLGEAGAALRQANGLEQLQSPIGDGVVPLGILSRRGMRLAVVLMLQPGAAFDEICLGLRQRLGGDGLVVLVDQFPAKTTLSAASRVAVLAIPDNATGDLDLWRALDVLDPRYRERRATDPTAIFDEVELEFSTVPGERHLVRLNGRELGGFQRSDLKFLRLLYLAAARAKDADVEGGGWVKKFKLQGDDKDHDLEDLRDELRRHEHPELSEAERVALVKTSPARDGTIRLAVPPSRIRFDESLARFIFIGEQQTASKAGDRKKTPGAAKLQQNLAQGQKKAKKLLADARKLGVPAQPRDRGEAALGIPEKGRFPAFDSPLPLAPNLAPVTLADFPRATEVTMRTQSREVRCKACNILLAAVDETGLVIRRGELQATIDGEFRAVLVCYRSRCRQLNVLRHDAATRPRAATA